MKKVLGSWMICPTCSGDGHHAKRLGSFTEEDRQDWSDDEWDAYMGGAYDDCCETCEGSGKVREGEELKVNQYFESEEDFMRWNELRNY